MAKLLATKPISTIMAEASGEGEQTLKRALGPLNLTTLGIGAIIGAGIFVLTGTAAAQFAGPAIVISFIIAGIGCVFAGLCYAEFASMIPIAGSAYTYGYATMGELVAWIIGWALVLEYAFGAATVCSGWSGYVLSLLQDFHIRLPPAIAGTPGSVFVYWNGHWELLNRIATKLAMSGIDPATLPHKYGVFNLIAFIDQGVGELQLGHRGCEGDRAADLPRDWNSHADSATEFVEVELASVYSSEYRDLRAVRHLRRYTGCRRDLLCLYRIRRGIDCGAGGEESEAGYADRHPRVAGDLHGSLHPGGWSADGTGELHITGRAGFARGRD